MSHAEFGVRVGAPRILELLAARGIASTWFVPGHTLETFPESTAAILAGGHEIGCHGWFHEDAAELARRRGAEMVERCADAVERVTGAPTARLAGAVLVARGAVARAGRGGRLRLRLVAHGRRLPALPRSPGRSPLGGRGLAVRAGGRARRGAGVVGARRLAPFRAVVGGGRDGLAAPSKVLEIWTEELRYAWAHAPGGLLTITMHPECIGRGHRMAMLERFIDAAAALDGVVFGRLDAYVEAWAGGS